jgi:hypothetical protein
MLLAASCLYAIQVRSQENWDLKREKDGIFIYTRSEKDSKFNELRAVFDLRGSLVQLRSILEDVQHYADWVYSTKTSSLIERKSGDDDFIYYAEVAAPWPVSNRDYYSETKIQLNAKSGTMQIESHNITNLYPPVHHLVRIPLLQAHWTIRELAGSMLHVEYELHWDPGGNVPPWLANMFSYNGPYQSFSQLKKKMAASNP